MKLLYVGFIQTGWYNSGVLRRTQNMIEMLYLILWASVILKES